MRNDEVLPKQEDYEALIAHLSNEAKGQSHYLHQLDSLKLSKYERRRLKAKG